MLGRFGSSETLDAGTVALEWKIVNALAAGPNGWKGVRCASDWNVDVPSAVCEVITRRGGGRVSLIEEDMIMSECGDEVKACCLYLDNGN